MGNSRSSRSPSKRHHHKSKHKKHGRQRDVRKSSVLDERNERQSRSNNFVKKKKKSCGSTGPSEFQSDDRGSRKHSPTVNSSSDSQQSNDCNDLDKNLKRRKQIDAVRAADVFIQRRQQQKEQQIIKDETSKRIELLVKKRVEEELIRRKDEIEKEVICRVEAAKSEMELELMFELEQQRERIREEARHREEFDKKKREELENIFAENNRRIEEAQRKLLP
ncbi:UPF0430 protein CG31712 isoform X3 [Rhagoletis pomonella]|uniref:UPF0430 protein CG31712 isoform X3 n=1 Tax=Rhagoletis pomonella TaxID=28610 RepID=UPI0017872E19|nr:UPF0430 protein CG31712 isoform X3 [Rhagoletis pomonella]